MISSPTLGLIPLNNCVLVELQQSRKNVHTTEGKYDTRTEGIVIAAPKTPWPYSTDGGKKGEIGIVEDLIGKRVFFEEFKEGARIKRDSKTYSFIKLEDIRGYEDVQPN